ncbi:MAG: LptF/LptG family permease, partial [Bacteroidota bacterium]
MFWIRRIDRYLFRQFVLTFVFVLAILVVVIIAIDFVEKLDNFLENDVPTQTILTDYYLNLIPFYANLLSPICVFLAAIFMTARMANNSEIIAMLSGGISFYRLLVPYLVAAMLFTGFSISLNTYFVPISVQNRLDFEYEHLKKQRPSLQRDLHWKVDHNVYLYLFRYDQWDSAGHQVQLEFFDSTTQELTQKLNGRYMEWLDSANYWRIHDAERVVYREDEITRQSLGQKDTMIPITPKDLYQPNEFVRTLTFNELNDYIERERIRGSGIIGDLLLEKNERLALPFSAIVLTIIGFALASRKRRGGIALQIGLGFIISFVYVFVLSISRLVFGDSFPPWVALWLPNMVFFVAALLLLRVA